MMRNKNRSNATRAQNTTIFAMGAALRNPSKMRTFFAAALAALLALTFTPYSPAHSETPAATAPTHADTTGTSEIDKFLEAIRQLWIDLGGDPNDLEADPTSDTNKVVLKYTNDGLPPDMTQEQIDRARDNLDTAAHLLTGGSTDFEIDPDVAQEFLDTVPDIHYDLDQLEALLQ